MKQLSDEELIKLDERLDEVLNSDTMLKAAGSSSSSVFRAAAALTQAEHPQVDAAMRERMRAKMLQAVPQPKVTNKKTVLRPNFTGLAARIAAVILIFLFAAIITPSALANSLPGDALYPAKRGLEQVELLFAGNEMGQVNVHFAQAERRIAENKRLLADGRFDAAVMEDALASLETGIRIANDNNLFAENTLLEAQSVAIFTDFNTTVDVAQNSQLVQADEIARLESSEAAVLAFLPSRMAGPSNSSEVTSVTATPVEEAETLVPTATSTATPEATEVPAEILEETLVYVNAEGNVNVREGAGTAYPVIARISPASAVTAIGLAGDWTEVRLADGRTGWIASFLLSETQPQPTVEITETTDTTATETTSVDTGTGATTGTTTGTGAASPTPCQRGRSCDSPGHSNGNSGNNSGGN